MKDHELLQEKVTSLEQEILEITASRDARPTSEWYVVDKLVQSEPKRGQIRLAVVLPGLISFAGIVMYLLLVQYLDERMTSTGAATYNFEYLSEDLATSVSIGITLSILTLSWFFAPLPCGFWAGLAWPGKHSRGYAVLGLLAGMLTMIGIIGAHMLTGGAAVVWGELAAADARDWIELLGFAFFGPALFFLSGGLFADVIKTRAYNKTRDLGLPEKVVARLFGSEQEPDKKEPVQRKNLLAQLLGPSLIGLFGALVRFAGEILRFAGNFFSH